MAKETVQVVFSADTQQARALFAEMASGQKRFADATGKTNQQLELSASTIGKVAIATTALSKGWDLIQRLITISVEKQKEFNRLARDRGEGSQSLAIEGDLTPQQEAAMNRSIDEVAKRRAAPNREFVRQLAEELLQVGMKPEDITGGGLESGTKILQAFNQAKPGGGTQLMRTLVSNMQSMGIPVNPQNMERAAIQFNELQQLSGLEFGPASDMLTGMARIRKSPRSVKALAGIGLKPEQIDPARAGIPGSLQALFNATENLSENDRAALFARLVGDDAATGMARLFAQRKDIRGGNVGEFERAATRASKGAAAESRQADIGLEQVQAELGKPRFDAALKKLSARSLKRGDAPWMVSYREWLEENIFGGMGGYDAAADVLEKKTRGDSRNQYQAWRNGKVEVEIKLPNQTRVPGVIKATENLTPLTPIREAVMGGGGLR